MACQPSNSATAKGGDERPASASSTADHQLRAPRAPAQPPGPEPTVVFEPAGKSPATVTVEVVKTPRKIRRGLMYRRHLAADRGMLFFMATEDIQTFWMRNTLIPLDMIFIGSDMKVAGVVENAQPLTDDSRYVDAPSRFVLEVNAGWAAVHGVAAGTPVRFEHTD